MIKADIVARVVNRTGLSRTQAAMAVETLFEMMKRAMERGERIELHGFGVFNVRPRKTGVGPNPAREKRCGFLPRRWSASSPVRIYNPSEVGGFG